MTSEERIAFLKNFMTAFALDGETTILIGKKENEMQTIIEFKAVESLIQEAKGQNRDLDAVIWFIFADHSESAPEALDYAAKHGIPAFCDKAWGTSWRRLGYHVPPPVTLSTEATLELMGRVRPDLRIREAGQLFERRGGKMKKSLWECDLHSLNDEAPAGNGGQGASLPLAILAALLDAVIKQKQAVATTSK